MLMNNIVDIISNTPMVKVNFLNPNPRYLLHFLKG